MMEEEIQYVIAVLPIIPAVHGNYPLPHMQICIREARRIIISHHNHVLVMVFGAIKDFTNLYGLQVRRRLKASGGAQVRRHQVLV
jgi:hypothetical protein